MSASHQTALLDPPLETKASLQAEEDAHALEQRHAGQLNRKLVVPLVIFHLLGAAALFSKGF